MWILRSLVEARASSATFRGDLLVRLMLHLLAMQKRLRYTEHAPNTGGFLQSIRGLLFAFVH